MCLPIAVETVPTKLLIVDDESSIRRLLKRCFEGAGYEVVEADSGESLYEMLGTHRIDLITLDIGLGSQDGLELARTIRQKHDIPIIMVTGKGDLIDTVVGLEVGADDYITKPFELREVLARTRAVLRRYETKVATPVTDQDQPAAGGATTENTAPEPASASTEQFATTSANTSRTIENPGQCYEFNGWWLDIASRELTDPDNQACELTTAEFELLKLLVTHPRHVLTRDQIMDNLKGNDWVPSDRTIDNQVSRLRRKLHTASSTGQLVKTVRGAGYMFNANVKRH